MKMCRFAAAAVLAFGFLGCWTVENAQRADSADLANESTVIFTRGRSYTPWFGSDSPWKYFEVTYEKISCNTAGQTVVEVGVRYKGGTSWINWWDSAPASVTMGAQCNFYRESGAHAGPAAYSTAREQLVFRRGETYAYRAVSPVKGVKGFQLVLGE